MFYFTVFNIAFVFCFLFFVFFKQINKISVMLLIGMVIIFFVPLWYIFLGGEKYLSYSLSSYYDAINIGTVSCLLIMLYIIFNAIFYNYFSKEKIINYQYKSIIVTYIFLYIILTLYIIYYINMWPLLKAFSGVIVDRPDIVKGDFKGYFLFSVIVNFAMPSLYFLYYKSERTKKTIFILFISLSFLLLIGGNKGVFMYFLIFNVIFVWKNIKIYHYCIIGFIGVFVYALIRLPYLSDGLSFNYLYESIFERIFLTQGMSVPAVIELSKNIDISTMGSNDLKYTLFTFVYGFSPGSMPMYYTAEIYARYDIYFLIIIGICISFLLSIYISFFEVKQNIGINWVLFMSLYTLVMSGISLSNMYILIFSLVWLSFLMSFENKKQGL
ncbi:hypothetical protein C9I87_17610 [Photobacterium iliopiscarium]|uniref:O-antigen polymerase n=1 Tax=Photobacterium iliopiscarium TaxID=56192 RepID=UPI000D17E239|nr:O-antigen polymerase [Photobacterium iliopiscarium]PST87756.1 hypothetical protein C9I87_17610 [Photobacterium iliopiscarium]